MVDVDLDSSSWQPRCNKGFLPLDVHGRWINHLIVLILGASSLIGSCYKVYSLYKLLAYIFIFAHLHAMIYYNFQDLVSEPACWEVVYVCILLYLIFHERILSVFCSLHLLSSHGTVGVVDWWTFRQLNNLGYFQPSNKGLKNISTKTWDVSFCYTNLLENHEVYIAWDILAVKHMLFSPPKPPCTNGNMARDIKLRVWIPVIQCFCTHMPQTANDLPHLRRVILCRSHWGKPGQIVPSLPPCRIARSHGRQDTCACQTSSSKHQRISRHPQINSVWEAFRSTVAS